MSSGKKIKTFENESEENLPFDIYDSDYSTRVIPSENNGNSFMDSKSSVRVASNTGGTALNEYDVDDEEDFISNYYYLLLIRLQLNYAFKSIANKYFLKKVHLFEQLGFVFNL